MDVKNKSVDGKASILVIFAGVFWGILSIFVRQLTTAGLTSMEIVCIRMILATVGMFFILLITAPSKLYICLRDVWMFICTGVISIALHNYCYFSAIQLGDASVAVVLEYTAPAFVMIMSILFFREKVTVRKILALALTIFGCVLTAGLAKGSFSVHPMVLLLGLSGGLFYATYSIFGALATRKYDAFTVTFYSFLFAAIATIPFLRVSTVLSIYHSEPSQILWSVGLGIFCAVLPYVLYTTGLKRLEAGRAAILSATDPLVGVLTGIIVFNEPITCQRILGVVLIITAVIILNFPARKVRIIRSDV